MARIKKKVEAVLFLAGKALHFDDVKRLCRARPDAVEKALHELQEEYSGKDSSFTLVEDHGMWKFTVRDEYMQIAHKIVSETELSKTVLETLAVIAFKYPILQSDLIKIRTNKAYDHLSDLEGKGFITRKKKGRTNLIKLTDRFFKYFDLPPDKLQEQFKDFEDLARAIEQKEEKIEGQQKVLKKAEEDQAEQDEKIKREIEELDESGEEYSVPLQTYTSTSEDSDEDGAKVAVVDMPENDSSGTVSEPEEKEDESVNEKVAISEEMSNDSEEADDDVTLEDIDLSDSEDTENKDASSDEEDVNIDEKSLDTPEVDKEVDKMMHPPKEE